MPRLSVSLLGPIQIVRDGQPVSGFAYDKVRALLLYLIVEAARPQRRDLLAALLWPDEPNRAARTSLRQALAQLRQMLQDHAADPPFLLVSADSVQFNPEVDLWLDMAVLTERLQACEAHRHRHIDTCSACAQRLAEAVALYRGDFLQDLALRDSAAFDEWLLPRREWLRRVALQALGWLASFHERRSRYREAREYTQRALELDPWQEEAHRRLMRVFAAEGDRRAAREQYERCRGVLQAELGVAPEAATSALYERIRAGAAVGDDRTPAGANNLPRPLAPLIGRERELAELAELLEQPGGRLITLTGLGGVGKTRLAVAAAAEQQATFRDGVAFVPLATARSAEQLVAAIATAVRCGSEGPTNLKRQLDAYLRTKEQLLVLDSLEQLLGPARSEVDVLAELLAAAPGVAVLATSRERLRFPGERVVEVDGLPYPNGTEATDVAAYAAVQLFVQRARQTRADFRLEADELAQVAHICRLVAGHPLAIELAASSVRARSCQEIVDEIETRLPALASSLRGVPVRHRSLRAVLDHSWKLLAPDEQQVLRRLAVFHTGFGHAAAQAVAHASRPLLAALVDKSMLRRTYTRDAPTRYDLHELVRQYAAEQLAAEGEAEQLGDDHLWYYLRLAEELEPKLRRGERIRRLEQLEEEHDNLRAALEWALGPRGSAEHALRLCGALWWFWFMRGHLSEGRRWLAEALGQTGTPAAARHNAHLALGSPPDPAALALRAHVLNGAGSLAFSQGDYAAAEACYAESLALRQALGDTRMIAFSLANLGHVAARQGDDSTASARFTESLGLFRTLGEAEGMAYALGSLGQVVARQGDHLTARRHAEESLALFRELGDTRGIAWMQHDLGAAAREAGASAAAQAHYRASLALRHELGEQLGMAECLEGLAGVTGVSRDGPTRAARLFAAAERLREVIGAPRPLDERPRYERDLAAARRQSDAATWQAAWDEGSAMTVAHAVAYALRGEC